MHATDTMQQTVTNTLGNLLMQNNITHSIKQRNRQGLTLPCVYINRKSETVTDDNKFRIILSWWERVDSNHRSRRQQIYSLPPLATREHSHINLFCFHKIMELVDGLEPPTC